MRSAKSSPATALHLRCALTADVAPLLRGAFGQRHVGRSGHAEREDQQPHRGWEAATGWRWAVVAFGKAEQTDHLLTDSTMLSSMSQARRASATDSVLQAEAAKGRLRVRPP